MSIPNDYLDLRIPTYAVCPIEYGEFDDCNDEDEQNIKAFLSGLPKEGSFEWPDDIDGDKYFSSCPEFGLPMDVIDVKYHYHNKDI